MKRDKHLPRGVYFRHGAFYHVRQRKWVQIGKTLRQALAAYAAYIETPTGGMAKLIDAALEHLRPKLAPTTARQYAGAAKLLKRVLVEFSPEQVKPRDVAALKRKLSATPNMANRVISFLRQVFDYALEERLVDTNPVVGIKRYEEKKRGRLLTLAEYQAIREHANARLQLVMDLCVLTGQRVGDVLRIRHADLTADGIRFEQQKTGAKGTVAWSPELRAAVERARGLGGNVRSLTHLFQSRHGGPPSYRVTYDAWEVACRAAGVPDARLHDLRALAATLARQQGKDATALLMHANASQTVRYLRDKREPLVEGPQLANRQKGGQSMDSGETG